MQHPKVPGFGSIHPKLLCFLLGPHSPGWYCCDRKSRAACAQNFAPWQQKTIEIMLAISLTIVCSRYIYNGVILHAHPVRGESHNQRNANGEVATTSPLFYNEPHRSHVLCVKAELRHDLHILVTAPFCCDRKSRAACAKLRTMAASNIEIMLAISLTIACSRYIYNGVILHAHPVRGESHNQLNATEEVTTLP